MSTMWGLVLGIIFFVVWVCFMVYYDSATSAYTQGRIDQIRHKNKSTEYRGIPAFFYKRGRRNQAKQYRLKVHSRMSRTGYGNIIPR